MLYSQDQIEELTHHLRTEISTPLDNDLVWRWDERHQAMLAEFAQNRSENVLTSLRSLFPHEWNCKTRKFLPKEIKTFLGSKSKLTKEQLILAVPSQDDTPTIIALWWPWGHGGTYSLRIVVHSEKFTITSKEPKPASLFGRLKELFA